MKYQKKEYYSVISFLWEKNIRQTFNPKVTAMYRKRYRDTYTQDLWMYRDKWWVSGKNKRTF